MSDLGTIVRRSIVSAAADVVSTPCLLIGIGWEEDEVSTVSSVRKYGNSEWHSEQYTPRIYWKRRTKNEDIYSSFASSHDSEKMRSSSASDVEYFCGEDRLRLSRVIPLRERMVRGRKTDKVFLSRLVVGAARLERATSCSQSRHSSQLSYAPDERRIQQIETSCG